MSRPRRSPAGRSRGVRRALVVAAVVLAVVVAVPAVGLVVVPPAGGGDFRPADWSPEPGFTVPAELVDPRASAAATTLAPALPGPEDLEADARGRVYAGTEDGRVVRLLASGRTEVVADVGGRPLGLVLDDDGALLVANHGVGLQRVTPDGRVEVLADAAAGTPILSANDVAVAPDGTVYLSDSTSRYNSTTVPGLSSYSLYDFLEGRPRGRVVSYDPATGTTREVATGLHFPNGVLVADDGASLLVAESTRYRVTRVHLAPPRAGERDVFLDQVPGILDGITRGPDGRIYLPMYDRVPALDRFVLPSGLLRRLAVRLPPAAVAARDPLPGSVLVVDGAGSVLRQATGFDPAPSNVLLTDDGVLLGSLEGHGVRRVAHDASRSLGRCPPSPPSHPAPLPAPGATSSCPGPSGAPAPRSTPRGPTP